MRKSPIWIFPALLNTPTTSYVSPCRSLQILDRTLRVSCSDYRVVTMILFLAWKTWDLIFNHWFKVKKRKERKIHWIQSQLLDVYDSLRLRLRYGWLPIVLTKCSDLFFTRIEAEVNRGRVGVCVGKLRHVLADIGCITTRLGMVCRITFQTWNSRWLK